MSSKVPYLTMLPGGLTTPRNPSFPLCTHQRLLIDEVAGIVECHTCGTELDPYVMLARYAEEETALRVLHRQIAADLARGVLTCVRCGFTPTKEDA